MKKKRILIIGKNGLIASHLYNYFKKLKNLNVKRINFKEFKKFDIKLKSIDYIISCVSNYKFVNNSYKSHNDFDYYIASKIKTLNAKLIIISTRKIYKPGPNLKENSKVLPNCNYSKNKFISETKIVKILNKKILILRLPNIISLRIRKCNKKLHKSYLELFFDGIKKGIIYDNGKKFKDFLPIGIFCKIVMKLIAKNVVGIFNLSIGKKVFLSDLGYWLNFYNKKPIKLAKYRFNKNKDQNEDSFYLNNTKLLKKINIKFSLIDIKKASLLISKKVFYEK
tara:strand:+ start:28264 stop:29106 length:843 start_codon:yes stop_codon:yes gene_type:complete